MNQTKHLIPYTNNQVTLLVILRILIGWHFLYEGVTKLLNPSWSSLGFLADSKGFLSGIFQSWASSPGAVNTIDFMNEWGLTLVGLGLIMGCFTRIALIGGIIMLAFYYLSHPPMVGYKFALPSEGAYLWVNKNLIELFAMAVLLVFPTQHIIGLDRLIFRKKYSNE
ncbi:MAG: DoxX family membrane protein [Bacteroidetes bacterium]|nr:DoxX family membrane protein [Bacteroidota bacterium]